MCKILASLLFAVLVLHGCRGDSHSLGSCPEVDPLPGFNMNRMVGMWYAIQKTSTSIPCLMYNISHNAEKPGHYWITEIEPHNTLWSAGLYHEHRTTGDLSVPDPSKPAQMALDLPFDLGTTTFTVFMTDYSNYVAVFTCKKLPLMHKWSAEILSRTRTLDMHFVDQVRTRLSSYNIDPFTMSIIPQQHCAPPGAKGSILRTASSVINKVGETFDDLTADISEKSQDLADGASKRVQQMVHGVSENSS